MALKQRICKRGDDLSVKDWIYYNDKGKWYGPVKITAKDGKSLFVVRGGRLVTVNTDHAQLATFDGEFLGHHGENVEELEGVETKGSVTTTKQPGPDASQKNEPQNSQTNSESLMHLI